jgi:excisionase family DNA binding protein
MPPESQRSIPESTIPVTLDTLAAKIDQLSARSQSVDRRFMTIERAAHYTDLSEKSMRRMISEGRLNAYRPVRGRILIDRHELDAAILGSGGQPRTGRGFAPAHHTVEARSPPGPR